MHDLICIDIGNTNISIGYYSGTELQETKRLRTVKFLNQPESLLSFIDDNPISYCSVVPKAESLLQSIEMPNRLHPLSVHSIGFLPISYPDPSEIGTDRLANAVAVFDFFENPVIVVDIGTASTFDVIDPKDGYLGGVIVPGPQGFLDFLNQNTALLPKLSLDLVNADLKSSIGKNTHDAMLLGLRLGYKPMVFSIVESLQSQLAANSSQNIDVVVAGGSSKLLEPNSFEQCPNLTLDGLAIAFNK